jgi:MoaA/NifB/PqqE/SkfB family radical SAM enzyme
MRSVLFMNRTIHPAIDELQPRKKTLIKPASTLQVAKAICANPQIIMAKPSVNWFLCQYLRKFTPIDVGGRLVIHSHLPPINSKAYSRFINEHLLVRHAGPSHAQIGLTNACPQHCEYCYNKDRTGKVMDTETIKKVIDDLKSLGVFWIGLTGGEPLLNKDIVDIVEYIGDDCTKKLFTTGCNLTQQLATELRQAGLFSVTVSLDHWKEELHDRVRCYKGAFRTALRAIEMFREFDDIHVGVSAVLSKEMLRNNQVEEFLQFLRGLGIHEAWLSETKPSVQAFWNKDLIITEDERQTLIALQDRYNKQGGMTVNYLGHFEDSQHFGCTAGHKMVYVDAFGEVGPCVFIPMTFGNVQGKSVREIVGGMRKCFPTEERCLINKNYETVQKHYHQTSPISKEDSLKILEEVTFSPLARFFRHQYP